MHTNKTYSLNQVMTNPRDGSHQIFPFEEFPTRAEAIKAAKRELKGAMWVVIEQQIVAQSDNLET